MSDGLYPQSTSNTHVVEARSSFRGVTHGSDGGEYRRIALDVFGQQDPRGRFSFTGARRGRTSPTFCSASRKPHRSPLGNADKFFRSNARRGDVHRRLAIEPLESR